MQICSYKHKTDLSKNCENTEEYLKYMKQKYKGLKTELMFNILRNQQLTEC